MLKTSHLYLRQMKLGPMENFVYLLGDKTAKEVAIVDPGWEADSIIEAVENENFKVKCILLTHGHYDHVHAIPELLKRYNVPVYISEDESKMYQPEAKNIHLLKDREIFKIGSLEILCISTPGHTPGGMCFLAEGHLLSGDTLFIDGCGRYDLPGGDGETLMASLQKRIMPLPDETIIYPGHQYHPRPYDTLKNQKTTNPYMAG